MSVESGMIQLLLDHSRGLRYLKFHDKIKLMRNLLLSDWWIYVFKVQTSPVEIQAKRDSLNAPDSDTFIRQSEMTRMSPAMKKVNDEERTNLLPKQDNS